MEGQIIKIDRKIYYVSFQNNVYACRSRGIFRKEQITPTVGDYCLFSKEKLLIEKILPRINLLPRPKVSNITQAFIVISLKKPDFSINLLDRFLVILYAYKVKPIICITKTDLVDNKEQKKIRQILDYYKKIGYTIVYNLEIDKIKKMLTDEVTVFTGQTGAGKSTLINKIDPSLKLEAQEISLALGRGKHTTREVTLYEICGGKVLDTPGFSLVDFNSINQEQIKDSFQEFQLYPCKYKDCSHTNEVECTIKKKVGQGIILKERYDDYLNFIKR